MQRKTKQILALIAIIVLFMQTLFGSLPAMAIENLPPLQTTMKMTSPDSATITQQATTADSVIIYVNATNGTGGDGENWGEWVCQVNHVQSVSNCEIM